MMMPMATSQTGQVQQVHLLAVLEAPVGTGVLTLLVWWRRCYILLGHCLLSGEASESSLSYKSSIHSQLLR